MEDLLKNPKRLEANKQREILDNLLMPLRDTQAVLPSVISRGAATVGQEEETQQKRQSVLQRLEENSSIRIPITRDSSDFEGQQ